MRMFERLTEERIEENSSTPWARGKSFRAAPHTIVIGHIDCNGRTQSSLAGAIPGVDYILGNVRLSTLRCPEYCIIQHPSHPLLCYRPQRQTSTTFIGSII